MSPRTTAAVGSIEPEKPVWETHLAVGTGGIAGQDVLALFNTQKDWPLIEDSTIGYAYWDGLAWSEGQIRVDDGNGNPNDDTTGGHQIDPVVIFDDLAEKYVCLAMNNQSGQKRLAVAHFDAADPSAVRWRDIWPTDHDPSRLDKPWMVAGENYAGQREFYAVVTYEREDDGNPAPLYDFAYMRSIDGGETWYGEQIVVPYLQAKGRWIWPAVVGDGPLYAAYAENYGETGTRVRFLFGTDDNTDPQQPRVNFGRLHCYVGGFGGDDLDGGDDVGDDGLDNPFPICLGVVINQRNVEGIVPGKFEDRVHTIPQLVADPTDPNRLYLVYHDTETADENDTDVNVYLSAIVRDGSNWEVLPRVQVNDDQNEATDQFLPSVVVDDFGVIHVIFYDDRQYVQDDSADDAKYDV